VDTHIHGKGGGAEPAAAAGGDGSKELTGAQQMAAAAAKEIPAEKRTYGDHRGLNMAMPDISGLQPIQGELPVVNGLGKPLAVLVMAKYAKGDFRTYCDFSALATKYGETLDFLGLMCDPEKKDSEALLGKEGKALAEQNIERFTVENMTLAWDEGKAVCKELLKIVTKSTVGPGDMFIFNPSGKCLWLENASGSWSIAQGQYADQIQRMQANATLLNNGPRPMLPGDEDIEEECDMGEGAGEYVDAFADGGNGDY
jgi:hypothetical protein